jgi:hypothetical protein
MNLVRAMGERKKEQDGCQEQDSAPFVKIAS